ncbi:hypothetical protein LQ938_07975 [Microbacterium sp. cx-55]|uniref:hypothetical protein n=1 Tax=Microbacterium sp. cx-55 TaxID=2875948 RepID=UPI001CC003C7|nr:hypothetical protein [Microbacterium sp. cx-55]MBZ4486319.1 hypothetical protein [Microbacterium sp. cx-55]UGB33841.1 hypothetical protein LQ938_07975 [Microbacterium sp. cx-55]
MTASVHTTLLPLLDEPVLRAVPAGAGPYPGEVIAWGPRPATRVRAEDAASDALWNAAGEHVAAVWEVLRTTDGHAVVLPQCTRSVVDLAGDRLRAGHPLSPGEVVTLAVSVVRGTVAEFAEHGSAECHGEWWVDADGEPLFVHRPDAPTADEAAIQAVRAITDACDPDASVVPALDRVGRALLDVERLPQVAAAREADLFAQASPEAIGTQVLARRARPASESTGPAAAPADRPAWQRLASAADAGVAEMVSQAVTSVWRAVRSRPPGAKRSRRGAVLAGLACAALVLAAGLLWPTGESDRESATSTSAPSMYADTAADAGTSPAPDEPAAPAPEAPAAPASPQKSDDAVIAVGALLDAARDCGGDVGCLRPLLDEDGALAGDGSAGYAEGAAFADDASRQLSLLDDVGGLVLVRADDATGVRPSQVVAAVRGEEKWVLRDIHDVAQHPG